jgi:hypothetical protein
MRWPKPRGAASDHDYCRHCHRLTRHTRGGSTGLVYCERCGKPQPPPITQEEALETLKRLLRESEGELVNAAEAAQ